MGTFLREMNPNQQSGLIVELVKHSNAQTEALTYARQNHNFQPSMWHLERLILQQMLLDASRATFVRTEAVMGLVGQALTDCEIMNNRYTVTIRVPEHGVVAESYLVIMVDAQSPEEATQLAKKHASVQMYGKEQEAERIEVVTCFLGTHKDLK